MRQNSGKLHKNRDFCNPFPLHFASFPFLIARPSWDARHHAKHPEVPAEENRIKPAMPFAVTVTVTMTILVAGKKPAQLPFMQARMSHEVEINATNNTTNHHKSSKGLLLTLPITQKGQKQAQTTIVFKLPIYNIISLCVNVETGYNVKSC